MAHHIDPDNGDLVIDTFQEGIADAPEQGIAWLRNINLMSIPGEACVNFAPSAVNVPPTGVSGTSCTFATSTRLVSWTTGGTNLFAGTAVTFGSTAGGVTANVVYWIDTVTNGATGTFKVYTDIAHTQLVNITDVSNTFTVITFGQPTHKALDVVNNWIFILDLNGRAWWIDGSGNLVHIGNSTLAGTQGNGICILGSFLYVFRNTVIDYLPTAQLAAANTPAWVYGWQTTLTSNASHYALAAQDNGMYFCNNQFVGGVINKNKAGTPNIDPTDGTTYTFNASALTLPSIDRANCLAELGTTLLVGGILNKIYPWDRISTSFAYPLNLSENLTTRMVTTNTSTYIFAGNRGRIYITNGSNVNLFKKIPDHIVNIVGGSNGIEPYYTWRDALYWKNQIYFSFSTSKNDGTAITNLGGVWALDVSMNIMGTPTSVALRMTNSFPSGAANYPYVIAPNISSLTPAGAGIFAAWSSSVITDYGVWNTTSTPYTNYDSVGGEVITDLVPTGILLGPKTFSQIEWKLAQEIVSGEAVRVSARQSNSQSWTVVGSTTYSANTLSDVYPFNVQNGQWIQLYVELQSAASSPSFCRLKELRLR